MSTTKRKTKVLIVGGGYGGKELIALFLNIKMVNIVGVVDIDPEAPGFKLAKEHNIAVGTDYNKFIKSKKIDEIINVTGKKHVQEKLREAVSHNIDVINGESSKLLWELMSEQLRIRKNIENSEKKFRAVFESTSDAVLILDNNKIIEYNPQTFTTLGAETEEQLYKKDLFSFTAPDYQYNGAVSFSEAHAKVKKAKSQGYQRFEWTYKRLDNNKKCSAEVLLSTINLYDKTMLLASLRDITQKKKEENKLKKMSMYDSLSNLYSRSFFEKKMNKLEKEPNSLPGIIMADIDGLKLINDTAGHDQGDQLIKRSAEILQSCFRQNDIIARVGGDEFAILLPNCNEKIIKKLCERINNRINEYNSNNPENKVSISIGYAVGEDTTENIREILKRADKSMYKQKFQKRNPKTENNN